MEKLYTKKEYANKQQNLIFTLEIDAFDTVYLMQL